MSSLKNLLKGDTPTASNDGSTSRSTGLGGQGSHFPKTDDQPLATRAADSDVVGSTVTGTEPSTAGPSDTSAAAAPVQQAQYTTGPEAGGKSHVGTVSSGDAAQSSAVESSPSYSLPKTLRSTEGSGVGQSTGTAAVGQTTTYSSQPLASGDPTSSVVDHQSTDPLTYKLPEAGSTTSPTSSTGVTSSAAATAASAAWSSHNKTERMPGEFPTSGYENPYKASSLDPRVDGGKLGSSSTQPTSDLPDRTRDTSGVGALSSTREPTGPAPSTLTTTADPADRSAEYNTSSSTKVPDSAPYATTDSQTSGEQQGVVGKALGALGLGGAASAAAGYLGYGAKSAETDEPRDTSAIATQPGVVAQESGPPKHYRRESIPTTAYPGGPGSSRPIAPPIGGTVDPRRSADQGYGDSSTGTRESAAATGLGLGAASATTGVPKEQYSESSQLRENVVSGSQGQTQSSSAKDSRTGQDVQPGTATADAIDAGAFPTKSTNKESELLGNIDRDPATVGGSSGTTDAGESHTGRNVAAGGAAAAAAGAGAYGLQHHRKSDDLRSSAAEDASRGQTSTTGGDTLTGGHSYTFTGGDNKAPVDAISSRDPNASSPSAPIEAVAAAPDRYQGQDYDQRGTGSYGTSRESESHTGRDAAIGTGTAAGIGGLAYGASDRGHQSTVHDATTIAPSSDQTARREQDDHTGRNAGLGAAAGTAAVGGAAYAAHEHSNERDLEKQREHDAKEAAKREKAAEKEREHAEKKHQKELEKEREHAEKKHQKELEKEEKHHQKELEKEEKRHQKEHEKSVIDPIKPLDRDPVATEPDQREQARLLSEEEDRKRREREAAAGVGAAAATGHHEEKEKKPSFFKRIFKRRKNKDTGEDEDYSTDDEDDKAAHHGRGAAAVGGAAAAGGSSVPTHHSETKGRSVLGHDNQPRDSVTGLQYDPSKDPDAAHRLSEHGAGTGTTAGTGLSSGTGYGTTAGTGLSSGTGTDTRPVEKSTGMPYDPSKDSEAAARLGERYSIADPAGTAAGYSGNQTSGTGYSGTDTSTGLHGTTGTSTGGIFGSEPLGEIGEHKR